MSLGDSKTRKYGVSDEKKDTSSSSFFVKLRDPANRNRFKRWIWLPTAMFTLGICVSQGGPTLLDLRIITDTDKETGSFLFTSLFAGCSLGSFAAGAVHGKISNNLVLVVATILGGAGTVATPYCSKFTVMIIVRLIVGFFLGSVDCSINAEHMRIWGIHGQALLQFIHFSFAIGGVIGPLISAPYLAEEKEDVETTTMPYLNVTLDPGLNQTDNQNSTTLPQTTDVHYAYLIAGIILAITAIPFFAMLLFVKKPETVEEDQADICTQREVPRSVLLFLIATLCTYYVIYTCVENTFSSFLETFLVDQYKKDGFTKAHGAYITTYFWASFAAGRFSAIFIANYLTPVRVLYMQLSLMVIAFSGFLISALYENIDALTAFSCLAGLALSSIYPTGISFIEAEIMKVTGRIAGVILVGGSVGATMNPYIIGYLMKNQSNFWFCYFIMGSVVVTCLLFVFLLLFNRLYVNKKYGTFDEQREREKQVTEKRPETVL